MAGSAWGSAGRARRGRAWAGRWWSRLRERTLGTTPALGARLSSCLYQAHALSACSRLSRTAAGVLGLPSPPVNPPNPNPNPNPHQDYKGLAWLFLGVANSDALLYDDEWQVLTLTQP